MTSVMPGFFAENFHLGGTSLESFSSFFLFIYQGFTTIFKNLKVFLLTYDQTALQIRPQRPAGDDIPAPITSGWQCTGSAQLPHRLRTSPDDLRDLFHGIAAVLIKENMLNLPRIVFCVFVHLFSNPPDGNLLHHFT